jgi:hypothetical protein
MRNKPDPTKITVAMKEAISHDAKHGGILRTTIERITGQTCARWFPFMRELAASCGMRCDRIHPVKGMQGGFTRFDFVPT